MKFILSQERNREKDCETMNHSCYIADTANDVIFKTEMPQKGLKTDRKTAKQKPSGPLFSRL